MSLDENAPDEQRLLSALLSRYEPSVRPVHNASDVVLVRFGLTLAQISDMVCNTLSHFISFLNDYAGNSFFTRYHKIFRAAAKCGRLVNRK